MTSNPKNTSGVAEPADERIRNWIEEALTYVGSPTWSPSLEREGRDLLAALAASQAASHSAPAEPVADGDAWPKLDKPARVVGTFGVGVSAGFVVRAAQRYYEATEAERKRTPQERRDDEIRRRAGWDLFNGYAEIEGAPAVGAETVAPEDDEPDAADEWRRLALQFDGHRMQALALIRQCISKLAANGLYDDLRNSLIAFNAAPPLSGEEVLADRIAALASPAQAPSAEPAGVPFHFRSGIWAVRDPATGALLRADKPLEPESLPDDHEVLEYCDTHAGSTFASAVVALVATPVQPVPASPAVEVASEPAFYINPKIIDPATGKISNRLNCAITWANKPTPKRWSLPVYLAAHPAAGAVHGLTDGENGAKK